MNHLWHAFLEGMPFSLAVLALGCLAPALLAERLLALRRLRRSGARLAPMVSSHLEQGDLAGAIALAERSSGVLARVVRKTLAAALEEPERVMSDCERVLRTEVHGVRDRAGAFRALGFASLGLGALGTLAAWIGPFGQAHADPDHRRALLAARLEQSLYILLLGLAVSLLFLVCGEYVRGAVAACRARIRAGALAVASSAVRSRRHLRLGEARPRIEPSTYRESV